MIVDAKTNESPAQFSLLENSSMFRNIHIASTYYI